MFELNDLASIIDDSTLLDFLTDVSEDSLLEASLLELLACRVELLTSLLELLACILELLACMLELLACILELLACIVEMLACILELLASIVDLLACILELLACIVDPAACIVVLLPACKLDPAACIELDLIGLKAELEDPITTPDDCRPVKVFCTSEVLKAALVALDWTSVEECMALADWV